MADTPERVYLALGSNLGDRLFNLKEACRRMAEQVNVLRFSSVYETPPWGVVEQPSFLNQVVEGETFMPPLGLLYWIKTIEQDMGREPGPRYGPRLIDLDILLYGEQCIDLPGLTIPHPRLAERAFVLVPLAELAPRLRTPDTNKRIEDMLRAVDRTGIVRFIG